ncbi:MAG: sugar phosphate isomerase/epimerase family protein [Christensenellales bacterium]|jgi:L-ribulose-5-phosphate 3-epimerase
MMKKSVNAWTIPDSFSFEECFACAKKAGFEGIELNVDAPGHQAHSLTLETTKDELSRIRALSEQYGVAVSGISTSLWGRNPIGAVDKEVRKQGFFLLQKQVEYCEALGADGVLIVPGGIGEDLSIKAAYESALETFREWKGFIEDQKVMIGVENVWNNFFISPMDMARFLDELSIRNLGAYFDVGNVMIFSRPEHWIEILGKRIQKIHVKDFLKSGMNAGTFVNLMEGSANWEKVVAALRWIGYDGYLTAELNAMPKANDYMMDITARALEHIISL